MTTAREIMTKGVEFIDLTATVAHLRAFAGWP